VPARPSLGGLALTRTPRPPPPQVKRFAQLYECHVWFVAHPRQMQDWQNRPPNLYDISGSAHFINKADNGLVVHRDWDGGSADVQVLVRKVRNKAAGKVGDCVLQYDRSAGVYRDVEGGGG
jgi:twinkle protein